MDESKESNDVQVVQNYQNVIIDMCVTRIMKGRIGKKTDHAFLVHETFKQIELFQAQPSMIKERIESLIEKNILKRSDKDSNIYEYIS